ncbi:hypothetical protein LMG33818_002613 [Halomonadaceae bacterium LMG 33818]
MESRNADSLPKQLGQSVKEVILLQIAGKPAFEGKEAISYWERVLRRFDDRTIAEAFASIK